MIEQCKTCIHKEICKYIINIEQKKCDEPYIMNCRYYCYNKEIVEQEQDNNIMLLSKISAGTPCNKPCYLRNSDDCIYHLNGFCKANITTNLYCELKERK